MVHSRFIIPFSKCTKFPGLSPFDSVISQGGGIARILKYRQDMRYLGGMGYGRMGGVVVGERESGVGGGRSSH